MEVRDVLKSIGVMYLLCHLWIEIAQAYNNNFMSTEISQTFTSLLLYFTLSQDLAFNDKYTHFFNVQSMFLAQVFLVSSLYLILHLKVNCRMGPPISSFT